MYCRFVASSGCTRLHMHTYHFLLSESQAFWRPLLLLQSFGMPRSGLRRSILHREHWPILWKPYSLAWSLVGIVHASARCQNWGSDFMSPRSWLQSGVQECGNAKASTPQPAVEPAIRPLAIQAACSLLLNSSSSLLLASLGRYM